MSTSGNWVSSWFLGCSFIQYHGRLGASQGCLLCWNAELFLLLQSEFRDGHIRVSTDPRSQGWLILCMDMRLAGKCSERDWL